MFSLPAEAGCSNPCCKCAHFHPHSLDAVHSYAVVNHVCWPGVLLPLQKLSIFRHPYLVMVHVSHTLLSHTPCHVYRVKIKHYSVAYFDRITMFEAL